MKKNKRGNSGGVPRLQETEIPLVYSGGFLQPEARLVRPCSFCPSRTGLTAEGSSVYHNTYSPHDVPPQTKNQAASSASRPKLVFQTTLTRRGNLQNILYRSLLLAANGPWSSLRWMLITRTFFPDSIYSWDQNGASAHASAPSPSAGPPSKGTATSCSRSRARRKVSPLPRAPL